MHPAFEPIKQLILQHDYTHLRELDALLSRAHGFISEMTEQDLLGLLLVVLDDRFDEELRSHTFEALETLPENLFVPAALSVLEHAVSDEENLDLLFNRMVFHPPSQRVLLEQLQHRRQLVPPTIPRVTRVLSESTGKRSRIATELLEQLSALATGTSSHDPVLPSPNAHEAQLETLHYTGGFLLSQMAGGTYHRIKITLEVRVVGSLPDRLDFDKKVEQSYSFDPAWLEDAAQGVSGFGALYRTKFPALQVQVLTLEGTQVDTSSEDVRVAVHMALYDALFPEKPKPVLSFDGGWHIHETP